VGHQNVEIKARCPDPEKVRRFLKQRGADFRGTDHQTDTYFRVPRGRLKLREGDIENHLIFYARADEPGPKKAEVILYEPSPQSSLKEILTQSLGILTVVEKRREIYFLGNVKFHIDDVGEWGTFIEIEAIDMQGQFGDAKLDEQCRQYMALLQIAAGDLMAESYSDFSMRRNKF